MKRENENEEKEDEKRVRYDHNERETEDNIDRLSYLPEFPLTLILSHLKAEDAVRTCILSSRWRHLWKHVPILKLKSSHFRTVDGFVDFVKAILSCRRDFSVALKSLDFELRGFRGSRSDVYADRRLRKSIRRVIRYACSQNVNHLRLRLGRISDGILRFPYFLFSSSSLTSLHMEFKNYTMEFPNSLNLPALTFLKLSYLSLYNEFCGCIDPFSTYKSLNTLILYHCKILGEKPLYISSSTLLKLSIHTPIHIQFYPEIVLFAPSLCTFDITCNPFQMLSGTHLSSIKQVRIDIFKDILSYNTTSMNLDLRNWFVKMTNIESLIVLPTTLQLLFSIRKKLKAKLPFLCNLKSLKVVNLYPNRHVSYVPAAGAAGTMSWKENTKLQEAIQAQLEPYSFIPCGVIDILLQNSPSATVDIVLLVVTAVFNGQLDLGFIVIKQNCNSYLFVSTKRLSSTKTIKEG